MGKKSEKDAAPKINRGFNPKRVEQEALSPKTENQWKFNEQCVEFLRNVAKTRTTFGITLTGEKDLVLGPNELESKFLNYTNAKSYVNALKANGALMIKNGLFVTSKKNGVLVTYIPDWDLFITALNVYIIMNGPY